MRHVRIVSAAVRAATRSVPIYAEYKARLARRAQERARANAENPAYMKRPYKERYLKKMMERQKRGRNA